MEKENQIIGIKNIVLDIMNNANSDSSFYLQGDEFEFESSSISYDIDEESIKFKGVAEDEDSIYKFYEVSVTLNVPFNLSYVEEDRKKFGLDSSGDFHDSFVFKKQLDIQFNKNKLTERGVSPYSYDIIDANKFFFLDATDQCYDRHGTFLY